MWGVVLCDSSAVVAVSGRLSIMLELATRFSAGSSV